MPAAWGQESSGLRRWAVATGFKASQLSQRGFVKSRSRVRWAWALNLAVRGFSLVVKMAFLHSMLESSCVCEDHLRPCWPESDQAAVAQHCPSMRPRCWHGYLRSSAALSVFRGPLAMASSLSLPIPAAAHFGARAPSCRPARGAAPASASAPTGSAWAACCAALASAALQLRQPRQLRRRHRPRLRYNNGQQMQQADWKLEDLSSWTLHGCYQDPSDPRRGTVQLYMNSEQARMVHSEYGPVPANLKVITKEPLAHGICMCAAKKMQKAV